MEDGRTMTAAVARRHRDNVGEGFDLADGFDPAYLDTEAIEAADLHCPGCRCGERRPSGIRRVTGRDGKVREFVGGIQI